MDRLAEGEECAVSALNHFLLRQLKGRSEKDYSRDSRVYRYGRCSFTLGPGFVPGAGYGPGAGFDSSTASGPAQVSAPDLTADEVVNKYLDALGGRDAIGKVKTMSVEGTMQVMGGDAPTTTITVDGVGAKQESEFNGTKIISCYTDKGGWVVNPMAGAPDPTPMPDDQYSSGKAGIYVGGPYTTTRTREARSSWRARTTRLIRSS